MKKILVIKGSARENGYTNTVLAGALENLADECKVSIFDSYKSAFEFCDGCGFCDENGECRHRDLDGFMCEFENCDVLVVASPVYNGTFTAPVKALTDRLQPYYSWFYAHGKTPKAAKRRKAVLLTASGKAGGECAYMEQQLRFICSVTNIEFCGTVKCAFTDTLPDVDKVAEDFERLLKRSLCDE